VTHTLHRQGEIGSLEKDYVVMVMAAQKFNDSGSSEKMKKVIEILAKYGPVNLGGEGGGIYTGKTKEDLLNYTTDKTYAEGVYTSKETLGKVLKDLKEASLGMSVVVSGLIDQVFPLARSLGIKPHTVNMSLGVFGPKRLLPGKDILEVTTMCGHDMVTHGCVKKAVKDILKGKKTAFETAQDLARSCSCGAFNVERASELLEAISAQRKKNSGGKDASE
jgi:hypothetical protein